MKKIFFCLFLFFSQIYAYAGNINQIIFFGDSLSDNGNLYRALLGVLPKSPPYFDGRFSNGPTWAEYVDKYYYDKFYVGSKIYAWGGASAIYHPPRPNYISPTLLEFEVEKYLTDSLYRDQSRTLFSIWIGGNDYLFYWDEDTNSLTQKVVDKISWVITTLHNRGGTHFLILNMPDFSKTPYAKANAVMAAKLKAMSIMHNLKLEQAINQIQNLYPDIKISFINIFDLFNDLIEHPEKYNEKYHLNITNTTEGCWKGNVTLNDIHSMDRELDIGNVPCANANEHIFWDVVHPTAVAHEVLAKIVIETLGDTIG